MTNIAVYFIVYSLEIPLYSETHLTWNEPWQYTAEQQQAD